MKKPWLLSSSVLLAFLSFLVPAAPASAFVDPTPPINMALGKPVKLTGSFFTEGWGHGLTVDPGTVTDGIYLPWDFQWDQGAVWWDSHTATGQYITINLGAPALIYGFNIQADGNDAYNLYYSNGGGGWQLAWEVPSGGWGAGPFTRNCTLPAPIFATSLKITGDDTDSDLFYCVSEVQALGFFDGTYASGYGYATGPDGAAITLMGVVLEYNTVNYSYMLLSGPGGSWICWNNLSELKFGESWAAFTGWFSNGSASIRLTCILLLGPGGLYGGDRVFLFEPDTGHFWLGAPSPDGMAALSGDFFLSNIAYL